MSRQHDESMDAFHAAVEAQEERAEAWSLAYRPETDEFYRDVEQRLTLRRWLECQGVGTCLAS